MAPPQFQPCSTNISCLEIFPEDSASHHPQSGGRKASVKTLSRNHKRSLATPSQSRSTPIMSHYTSSDRETVSHRLWTAWEYISSSTRGMIGEVENSSTSSSPNENQPNLQPCQHVNAELPAKRRDLAPHLPVSLETCRDCYLCRWRKKTGLAADSRGRDLPKSWWKCNYCDVPLCQLCERNCFLDFHSI